MTLMGTEQSDRRSDRRNDFTAEGDGRSSGEEDSDAGEKSELLCVSVGGCS